MEGAGRLGGNQRGRPAGGECVLADSEPGRGSRGSERSRAPHEKIARTATVEDLTGKLDGPVSVPGAGRARFGENGGPRGSGGGERSPVLKAHRGADALVLPTRPCC